MNEILSTISEITDTIADSDRPLSSFQLEIMDYSLLLRRTLLAERSEFIKQRELSVSSIIDSGAALSPWKAASVVDDRIRTAAFIRGCIKAIEFALDKNPKRPLHLVEAGCGPLGALVIPLLARFSSDELEVSVIDLHQESIDSFCRLIEAVGLSDRIRQAVCGDATQVRLDSDFDLALSETMCAALTTEPQVSIARAFVRENPETTLLPESIRVNLTLMNWAAELEEFPHKVLDRIEIGQIFELNRKSALELEEIDGCLPAARLTIPEHDPVFLPSVTTEVEIFNGVVLSNYDSEISAPMQLPVNPKDLKPGDEIQFRYRMGDTPWIEWTINDSELA
ncbi:MAG: hypothetical protein HKN25_11090 [Pyrinomonadaceae bacterium]|nr:hypothetical protein [Pyrinomonadaceae bacterium]